MIMQDYSCYCTAEQTRRAYSLGAPIEKYYGEVGIFDEGESKSDWGEPIVEINAEWYIAPTTQQMIGWLREEKHLTIVIDQRTENNIPSYRFLLRFPTEEEKDLISDEYYGTWNKMELTAIDAALDYLEKKNVV